MPQVRELDAKISPRFTLMGPGIVPDDEAWDDATVADRRLYFRMLAREVAQQKDAELAAGLDWRGEPLTRIRPRTWAERRKKFERGEYTDWTGPPLMPQYETSRTRRLLQVVATSDRVVGYWSRRWGRILRYHCKGAGHLPKRDVCGLTVEGIEAAVARARADWLQTIRSRPVPLKPVPVIAGAQPKLPPYAQKQFREIQRTVEKYPFLAEFRPKAVIVGGKTAPGHRGGLPPRRGPRDTPVKPRSFWGRAFRAAASFFASLFA